MPNDIEELKQDFLCYINFLVFPSPEILVGKISPIFQKNALSKIKIKHDNEKILFTEPKDKICHLTKSDLGKYGLSVEDFRKGIEDIKSKDPKKIFLAAVKEIIILHNKKLCEIYIPSVILIYTKLFEKVSHVHPKKNSDKIHNLILRDCIDAISPENPNSMRILYNLLTFISAYQHPDLDFTDFLKTIDNYQDDGTCKCIFNTTKTIQLTSYKETYINLIQLIEELDKLQVKDKVAIHNVITKLKDTTTIFFRDLIQAAFYEKQEKYIREREITKKLRNSCFELIEDYRNEHIDEFKNQEGIFLKILRFIVNLFPTSIISDSKKMTLFFNKKENYIKRTSEITSQLDQLATLNFFRRYL